MATGIGFMDILVSEIAMVIGVVLFLFCGGALIVKRKTFRRSAKAIFAVLLILSAVYLAFILWAVIMWGGSHQPAAALY